MPKRNVIILGSGRSGTSLVAGVFAKAGYFIGDDLWLASPEFNPKGFFEDKEVNAINGDLITRAVLKKDNFLLRFFSNYSLSGRGHLDWQTAWLERMPLGTAIVPSPDIVERIKKMVGRSPFCFKDPRFCYTLSAWRPFLQNTVFICIFRHPAVTAVSILKSANAWFSWAKRIVDYKYATELWELMYRHVLEMHRREGEWLFCHYNQVLKGDILDKLGTFTGAPCDRSFPDVSIDKRYPMLTVPKEIEVLYNKLCQLAGYEEVRKR